MIVRILDEGQFEIDDKSIEELEELDSAMLSAIEALDEGAFRESLDKVLAAIHEKGTKIKDPAHIENPIDIRPSDLVVPSSDATLEEVRSLLASGDTAEDEDDEGVEAGAEALEG